MLIRALFLFTFALSSAYADSKTPPNNAIASAHPLATEAGIHILKAGGNAFDAAVAVTAVLAVVEPYSSGLGGGGFYLLHRDSDGADVMLDAREKAPLESHRDMYIGSDGEPTRDSLEGPLSAGIPGIPAALVQLADEYGKLSLEKSLAAAISVAREGFPVDDYYRRMVGFRIELLRRYPSTAKIFLQDGEIPEKGFLIVQNELADTLERLVKEKASGFYAGEFAASMVAAVRKAGGIWQPADLAQYSVVMRKPIRGEYRGWRMTSAAPPSSGGVALVTMLNILSAYDLDQMDEVGRTHHIVEAMRQAYRDRAEFLGDTDFVDVPIDRLIGANNSASKRAWIKPNKATSSASLPAVPVDSGKGRDTTHFSILDKEGNRVAATLSINYPFGSGFVVPGTGVLLNDEMDDFSAKPGEPNAYGLVGAEANAIEPGKRPLSSMSPTFIENDERVVILGTPGGSRIISMVLLGVLDAMEGGDAKSVVSRPRFHHQYLPDAITFESDAFSASQLEKLESMGHQFAARKGAYGEENPVYGNMQAVIWNKRAGKVGAASDPRGIGHAIVD